MPENVQLEARSSLTAVIEAHGMHACECGADLAPLMPLDKHAIIWHHMVTCSKVHFASLADDIGMAMLDGAAQRYRPQWPVEAARAEQRRAARARQGVDGARQAQPAGAGAKLLQQQRRQACWLVGREDSSGELSRYGLRLWALRDD